MNNTFVLTKSSYSRVSTLLKCGQNSTTFVDTFKFSGFFFTKLEINESRKEDLKLRLFTHVYFHNSISIFQSVCFQWSLSSYKINYEKKWWVKSSRSFPYNIGTYPLWNFSWHQKKWNQEFTNLKCSKMPLSL